MGGYQWTVFSIAGVFLLVCFSCKARFFKVLILTKTLYSLQRDDRTLLAITLNVTSAIGFGFPVGKNSKAYNLFNNIWATLFFFVVYFLFCGLGFKRNDNLIPCTKICLSFLIGLVDVCQECAVILNSS